MQRAVIRSLEVDRFKTTFRWQDVIARYNELNVAVIGDAMLDAYTQGAVNRISPEGPAAVFDVQGTRYCPGGAANTAANLAALGAKTKLITVIGNDEAGERIRSLLERHQVNIENALLSNHRRTLSKHRLQSGSQQLMRVDEGTTARLDDVDECRLEEALASQLEEADLVVVSDYGYGIMTPRLIDKLNDRRAKVWLGVDSKSLTAFANVHPDVVKPNYAQARRLLGLSDAAESRQRCEGMVTHSDRLLALTGARTVAITCDHDGCVCLQADAAPVRLEAQSCRRPGVIGAGDTFLSAFALSLAAGGSVEMAAHLATSAAGLVVYKECTATCTAAELVRCQVGMGRSWELQSLSTHLAEERRHGRRIVLTCGCFDILHHGHVDYLRRAKALGDRLVVAVNTDASIHRLKGSGRPINSLADRLEVLAALDCIDYLLAFEEDRPDNVISAVRPNVFVKGGDYTIATLPEAPLVERLGGEIQFIPLVAGRSTTRIIDRILSGTAEPVATLS